MIIVWITIFYILGIAIGMIMSPSYSSQGLFFAFVMAFGSLTALSFHEWRKKLVKFGRSLFYGGIALASVFLGLWSYTRAVDTSSPYHIVHYCDENRFAKTVVRGVVVKEPDVREGQVRLIVEPYEVKVNPRFKKWKKVDGGRVLIYLRSSFPNAYSFDYMDEVEVFGSLLRFPASDNPGVFDMRKYWEHQGVYAYIKVKKAKHIRKIGVRSPNFLFAFAYSLKNKMLAVFKRTIPYPESAFLGGVTLGLRSGLPYEVQDEFRASGVAHVLAVSGLHVGFIATLFMAFFALLKIKEKYSAPLIVIALVIFTIFTGARPATVRASLMFSIFLIVQAYFKNTIRVGLMIALALSALVYLLFNPLMLPEPSFVMSYTAILSLGLLATPLSNLIRRADGPYFWALMWLFVVATVLFVQDWFWSIPTVYSGLIFFALAIPPFFVFPKVKFLASSPAGMSKVPKWITDFFGAQLGINLGNVIPISAFYFNHIPVASFWANWIAIPLIGIIVQLGIIAGLLGLLWLPLGLVLNAGNWIACKVFLWSVHFFSKAFPYPVASRPSILFFGIYYFLLAVFVLWSNGSLKRWWIEKGGRVWWWNFKNSQAFRYGTALVIIAFAVLFVLPKKKEVKITFINTMTLGRYGDGSAELIETPNSVWLIDGGPARFKFGKDFVLPLDVGKMVITPILADKDIGTIDYVVLTSISPERIGGINYILKKFNVKKLIVPLSPSTQSKLSETEGVLTAGMFSELSGIKLPIPDNCVLSNDIAEVLKTAYEKGVEIIGLKGKELKVGGEQWAVKVFCLDRSDGGVNIALRVEFLSNSVLVANECDMTGRKSLLKSGKTDVAVLPSYSNPAVCDSEFFEKLKPNWVVAYYYYKKGRKWDWRVYQRAVFSGARVYRPDVDGAVEVVMDGRNIKVSPFIKRKLSERQKKLGFENFSSISRSGLYYPDFGNLRFVVFKDGTNSFAFYGGIEEFDETNLVLSFVSNVLAGMDNVIAVPMSLSAERELESLNLDGVKIETNSVGIVKVVWFGSNSVSVIEKGKTAFVVGGMCQNTNLSVLVNSIAESGKKVVFDVPRYGKADWLKGMNLKKMENAVFLIQVGRWNPYRAPALRELEVLQVWRKPVVRVDLNGPFFMKTSKFDEDMVRR